MQTEPGRHRPAAPLRGFTLIELLVVIAIIAILAAILFPVFARARQRAQLSTCQSNLKQFGQAAVMYENDHDGKVLPGNLWNISSWTAPGDARRLPYYGADWLSLINPYLRTLNRGNAWNLDQSMLCPVAPKVQDTNLRRPYGYNAHYLGHGAYEGLRQYNVGQATAPSSTVRIAEVWNFDQNWGSLYIWPPISGGDIDNYAYPPGFHSGHVGRGNTPALRTERMKGTNTILWLDGHVSTISGNRLFRPPGSNFDTDGYFRLRKQPGDPA